MDIYRFDYAYNSVYKYDGVGAYIFCGKLNGRSEAEFIKDQEDFEDWEE